MKKFALLIVIAVVFGGYFLITKAPTPTPIASPTASSTPPAVTDAEVRIIEVSGEPFSFAPNQIKIKKGEKVAVKFTNTEGFHDFVIDELSVKTQVIPQGQSEQVMIPTETAGTYVFYCSVGDHRTRGMVGALIIE